MKHGLLLFAIVGLFCTSCGYAKNMSSRSSPQILGTYASPPRFDNQRVDANKLIAQLKDLHANTYNFLIWQHTTDWDDLQLFLPLAQKNKINVWVTLVPPSESQPKAKWNAEPYKMNYEKWATEIAKLSKRYSNLVACSIDDFAHNLDFYTPAYLQKMRSNIRTITPTLQFIPCLYYKQITQDFADSYGTLLDGILFPYRAESKGANLQDATAVASEIANIRKLFKRGLPVLLDVYATVHSRLGASTPEYVRDVILEGKKYADGVLIYTHPTPETALEKYQYVKEQFSK